MKRLIPGKVRFEGVELYESGKVLLDNEEDKGFSFRIEEYHLFYSYEAHLTTCSCKEFPQYGYCKHLAAVEAYLNYQLKLNKEATEVRVVEETASQPEFHSSSLFLDSLSFFSRDSSYHRDGLSIYGEWDSYSNDILWTLKLSHYPSDRAYVIRDIPSFLNMVGQGANYQVGQSAAFNLSYQSFDSASQNLLDFLSTLLGAKGQNYFSAKRYFQLPAALLERALDIFQGLKSFQLNVSGRTYERLSCRPLTAESSLFSFEIRPDKDYIAMTFLSEDCITLNDGLFLFYQGNFYGLSFEQATLLKQLLTLPIEEDNYRRLYFSWDEQDRVIDFLQELKKLGRVNAPKAFRVVDFTPTFQFSLNNQQMLCLKTVYHTEGFSIFDLSNFEALPLTLNPKKRRLIEAVLRDFGFDAVFEARRPSLSEQEVFHFFHDFLPQLKSIGQVSLADDLADLLIIEAPNIKVALSGQLLKVDFDVSQLNSEDLRLAIADLNDARPYHVLPSGQLLTFSEEFLSLLDDLRSLGARENENGAYVLPALSALRLNGVLSSYANTQSSEELEQLYRDLAYPEHFTLPPLSLTKPLRDYQQRGVQWLSVLDHYGFGGILADDMGLGKTLQTIAFLSSRLGDEETALILAPASLIYNWQEEFAKFYPDAKVQVVYGSKEERKQQLEEPSQVYITSYQSFRQDILDYQIKDFEYLILDEAQVLKNHQTKLSKLLATFKAKRVFALSGTPIENRLLEVWSLFEIVLPGLFGNKKEFSRLSPQEVAQMIQPFVLRRTKEEVLTELPVLTEVVYQNDLSSQQKSLYLAQLQQLQERVTGMTPDGFTHQRMEVLSGLTRLRQICDTPALFMPYEAGSGKLDSLRQLLQMLQANGHRALIFSQFRGMLDLIENEVSDLGLSSFKITGSTPSRERQEITRAFNKGARNAVLISLKAGGVGLNLTGADVVILVDLWWNPAVDMQAIGRAHRLGQTKQVTVYRLITHGTIEEKILQLQEQKRDLISQVLRTEESRKNLTLDDIKDILGISN